MSAQSKHSARRPLVAVIGPSEASDPRLLGLAERVGWGLGEAGFTLITGATTGVMAAASRGAASAGAGTVGVTPSGDPGEANEHVEIVIASGLGEGRNVLIVNSADAFVCVGKSHGTLSELALALRAGKRVVSLESYGREIDGAIRIVSSPEEAVALVGEVVRGR